MITLEERLNLAGFADEDCCVEFNVVALSSTCVDRSYGKLCFPEEVLKVKISGQDVETFAEFQSTKEEFKFGRALLLICLKT
jgi:hypothetical protein